MSRFFFSISGSALVLLLLSSFTESTGWDFWLSKKAKDGHNVDVTPGQYNRYHGTARVLCCVQIFLHFFEEKIELNL
jgi:hypothetical protein